MKTRNDIMAEQGFISASKAAEVCHCSIYRIYRMLNDGKVKGTVLEGHRYVSAASLLEHYTPAERKLLGITLTQMLAPKESRATG